jgi:hypothetical protein
MVGREGFEPSTYGLRVDLTDCFYLLNARQYSQTCANNRKELAQPNRFSISAIDPERNFGADVAGGLLSAEPGARDLPKMQSR